MSCAARQPAVVTSVTSSTRRRSTRATPDGHERHWRGHDQHDAEGQTHAATARALVPPGRIECPVRPREAARQQTGEEHGAPSRGWKQRREVSDQRWLRIVADPAIGPTGRSAATGSSRWHTRGSSQWLSDRDRLGVGAASRWGTRARPQMTSRGPIRLAGARRHTASPAARDDQARQQPGDRVAALEAGIAPAIPGQPDRQTTSSTAAVADDAAARRPVTPRSASMAAPVSWLLAMKPRAGRLAQPRAHTSAPIGWR